MRTRIHPIVPFVAPMLTVMSLVLLFPLGFSIYLSFAKITPQLTFELSGLGNYARVIRTPEVWRAFGHSGLFTLASVTGQFLVGLTAALLLNQELKARRWLRLALLLPWVIPPVVTSLTWRWLLDSQFGLINDWLVRLGILSEFHSWLGDTRTAMPVTILVAVWRGFPFMMIMLLAALQFIPREQYEAAQVDGAGTAQQFRYVTLPGLRYTIAVATTLSAIWAFKEFALVQILTEGGPAGSTEVVGTLVYKMFFHFTRFGDAAALGVLILLVLLVASYFYVRLVVSTEER